MIELAAAEFGADFAFEAADDFVAEFANIAVGKDMVECLEREGVGE
jgi:hypothetical protein